MEKLNFQSLHFENQWMDCHNIWTIVGLLPWATIALYIGANGKNLPWQWELHWRTESIGTVLGTTKESTYADMARFIFVGVHW